MSLKQSLFMTVVSPASIELYQSRLRDNLQISGCPSVQHVVFNINWVSIVQAQTNIVYYKTVWREDTTHLEILGGGGANPSAWVIFKSTYLSTI